MITPLQADAALLADVARGRGQPGLRLWWLGQSGFLLQWAGGHVLVDPYLSDALTRKYAGTDRPHVRMTTRAVDPARLDFVDVVSSSHNHTDHLDAETLGPVLAASPAARLVIPEANRVFVAQRLGMPVHWPIGLDAGMSVEVAGVHFTGIAAAHEEVERDEAGRCRFLGYVLRLGGCTVYHSGDTLLYGGLVETLRPLGVDVALLPINGRDVRRGVAGNLDGPEAARLARAIGARLVIPCHYEMFEFNTASPAAFLAECHRSGQECAVLRCGERWDAEAMRG